MKERQIYVDRLHGVRDNDEIDVTEEEEIIGKYNMIIGIIQEQMKVING
jgi:hypothetical protein